MNNKKDSSDISGLPVPYINPWTSLKRDIKSIGSDIFLRIRELIRRNQEGELLSLPFLPKYLKVISFPFMFIFVIVIIFYILSRYQLYNTKPEEKNVKVLETSIPNFSKGNNVNNYFPNANYSFTDKEDSDLLPDKIDLVLFNILNEDNFFEDYPDDLFLGSESKTLKNGILIKVGRTWHELNFGQKTLLSEHLLDIVYLKGYENLQLYDEIGHLLARNSRIGKEIILFEQV